MVPQHCQDVCKIATDYRSILDSRFTLPIINDSKVSQVTTILFYLYLSDRLIFDFVETLDIQEEERYLSWQY